MSEAMNEAIERLEKAVKALTDYATKQELRIKELEFALQETEKDLQYHLDIAVSAAEG